MSYRLFIFDLDGTLLPMDMERFTNGYFQLLTEKMAPLGYAPKALIDAVWAGTAAMVNMGSWFLATMQQYNANAAGEGYEPVNFGMVKYPHPDGSPAGSTLGTVTSLGVNKNSANKEAAFDFVNWCASAEGAAVVASTGTFPAVSTSETMDIIAATDGFPRRRRVQGSADHLCRLSGDAPEQQGLRD